MTYLLIKRFQNNPAYMVVSSSPDRNALEPNLAHLKYKLDTDKISYDNIQSKLVNFKNLWTQANPIKYPKNKDAFTDWLFCLEYTNHEAACDEVYKKWNNKFNEEYKQYKENLIIGAGLTHSDFLQGVHSYEIIKVD